MNISRTIRSALNNDVIRNALHIFFTSPLQAMNHKLLINLQPTEFPSNEHEYRSGEYPIHLSENSSKSATATRPSSAIPASPDPNTDELDSVIMRQAIKKYARRRLYFKMRVDSSIVHDMHRDKRLNYTQMPALIMYFLCSYRPDV